MAGQGKDHALDHVVVVVFENRSLDNVLGRLYGPGDGKTFDGVIGKDLTNPIHRPRPGRPSQCTDPPPVTGFKPLEIAKTSNEVA